MDRGPAACNPQDRGLAAVVVRREAAQRKTRDGVLCYRPRNKLLQALKRLEEPIYALVLR